MNWQDYYPPAQDLTEEEIQEEIDAEWEAADIYNKELKENTVFT